MTDHDRRLALLEASLIELREELERLRQSRGRSMCDTHRCPVCDGTKVLHFRHVPDAAHLGVVDLTLQKEWSRWWGMQHSGGPLEAFVCRACRLVEWHAISLDEVRVDGEGVVELTATEPAPEPRPYR